MAARSLAAALRRPSQDLDAFQGLWVRSAVWVSVVLLVVACLPAWWHTTAIERRALPSDPVLDQSEDALPYASACLVRFPVRIQLEPTSPYDMDWAMVAQDAQDEVRRTAVQVADADRSSKGDGGVAACLDIDVVPVSARADQYVSPPEALLKRSSYSDINGTAAAPDPDEGGYVLDYHISIYDQNNFTASSKQSALIPLALNASASNAGADVAAGILELLPLTCLSRTAGVCDSDPAGEASNKAIQYMRSVEIVFTLVQEDTTSPLPHGDMDREFHTDGAAAGLESDWPQPDQLQQQPDLHQYTSWSLPQELEKALRRVREDPRTPTAPQHDGASHESHGADKLAATLFSLSQSGLHHFQLTTQMLYYAPLAFEPTLDTVSWTAKEYVPVQRAIVGSPQVAASGTIPSPDKAQHPAESRHGASRPDSSTASFLDDATETVHGVSSDIHEGASDSSLATAAAAAAFDSTNDEGASSPDGLHEMKWFMEEQEVIHTRNRSIVEPADLQTFVNAGAWSLGGSLPVTLPVVSRPDVRGGDPEEDPRRQSSRQEEPQTLHMLYFVPAPRHRPLLIRGADGDVSPSHSWVIPQWGGVVLEQQPEAGHAVPLGSDRLDDALLLWDKQLRKLLGVPSPSPSVRRRHLHDGGASAGAPPFATDLLALARVHENVRTARDTLRSTKRLIQQMQALGVDQHVHADFETALASLHAAASEHFQRGEGALPKLLQQSWDASFLATRSFLHPSMIAQLYFPDEHKYAVYTPLFAPAAVPILVSLLRLVKTWRSVRGTQVKKRTAE